MSEWRNGQPSASPTSEREIDEVLLAMLGDELLALMLRPPPVPTFARDTVRPRGAQ